MFDSKSRYFSLETGVHEITDGRRITYVRRRFIPGSQGMAVLTEVTVNDGDRLDLITARTLGDPELFWRICDTNEAMNPFDLVDEPGVILNVSLPKVSP